MTEPTQPETEPTQGEPAADDGKGKPTEDRAGGEKAILAELKSERVARQELQKQLKELESLKALAPLAQAIGVKAEPGTDPAQALQDRIAAMERKTAEAEARALRAEVAQAKGLTPAQAKRLQGSTREELETDAEDLLASFPTPSGKSAGPKPDPTQGARSGGAPGQLTKEDVERLFKEGKHTEIEKARVEGRIDYDSARKR